MPRESVTEYHKRRRHTDPAFKARHYACVSRYQEKTRHEIAELVVLFKADGCGLCDEKSPCCLVAHHREPGGKDFNIGDACTGKKYSARRVAAELEKCVCVCLNCHAKLHAGIVTLPG